MATPYPKSTVKLALGDYCALMRDDGRYVPLAFLATQAGARSYFHGALLSHVSDTPEVAEDGPALEIDRVALLHVEVFRRNEAPILGSVAERLDPERVRELLELTRTKVSTWGWRTPLKYANRL